jgi:hypothetical protein
MLRFKPDSWLEGLMRPILMADPVAGLYFEAPAPDWRFAALAVLLLLLGVTALVPALRPLRPRMPAQHAVTVLGLLVTFYVWTFASGNSRYFSWGLLLVGPLSVMVTFMLPIGRGRRWVVVAVLLLIQGTALYFSYRPNPLSAVGMTESAAPLQASPLRDKPAVFLTASLQSYSVLVPLFHPESRWAHIAGQFNLLPGTTEWPRLQALLQSPLPIYVVVASGPGAVDAKRMLAGGRAHRLQGVLSHHGLVFSSAGCQMLLSALSNPDFIVSKGTLVQQGFWVCAVERESGQARNRVPASAATEAQPASAQAQALDAVEQRCPRFFPPGGGRGSLLPGVHDREYPASDVRLWVDRYGDVNFYYFGAADATTLGTVEEVRAGRFSLPCGKLPGRYAPFWQRP